MGSPDDTFLSAVGVSKRFGSTQALDSVSVSFRRGEVHALMGENGAGKSTLGKAIAGLHRPDSGTITLEGRVLHPGDIDDAFDAGVRLVHQELAQCPNLTVAENLCLHDIPRSRFGVVDFRAMTERAARLVHAIEPAIDVESPLGLLSPGRRQICQIAAALDQSKGRKAKVIVFDEPTSSLSVAETDRLLAIIRSLAKDGITVLYVSHRMGEIFDVCDRVTVLRDGKFVATSRVSELDEATLVQQMIGRKLITPPSVGGRASAASTSTPVLEVRSLNAANRIRDVSLSVRPGEIVGIGGLVGAGRSELLDAIFGLDHAARGEVRVGGTLTPRGSIVGAIRAGMGYVPEDRRRQGLFFDLGVGENTLIPFMHRLATLLGVRRKGAERQVVRDKFTEYQIKAASQESLPGELSGGNQQKLLIARWMGKDTRVILLDEPTRGIDVGTKAEVYRLVRSAAERGAGVLLVSSEMPELLALSDRILVMCEGRVTGELTGEAMTQENILRLATQADARAAPAA